MANPPGFVEGFVVNLDYLPEEYGQVFENLGLETPHWPGDVNILIIPGLPSRIMGSTRGVAIAY